MPRYRISTGREEGYVSAPSLDAAAKYADEQFPDWNEIDEDFGPQATCCGDPGDCLHCGA